MATSPGAARENDIGADDGFRTSPQNPTLVQTMQVQRVEQDSGAADATRPQTASKTNPAPRSPLPLPSAASLKQKTNKSSISIIARVMSSQPPGFDDHTQNLRIMVSTQSILSRPEASSWSSQPVRITRESCPAFELMKFCEGCITSPELCWDKMARYGKEEMLAVMFRNLLRDDLGNVEKIWLASGLFQLFEREQIAAPSSLTNYLSQHGLYSTQSAPDAQNQLARGEMSTQQHRQPSRQAESNEAPAQSHASKAQASRTAAQASRTAAQAGTPATASARETHKSKSKGKQRMADTQDASVQPTVVQRHDNYSTSAPGTATGDVDIDRIMQDIDRRFETNTTPSRLNEPESMSIKYGLAAEEKEPHLRRSDRDKDDISRVMQNIDRNFEASSGAFASHAQGSADDDDVAAENADKDDISRVMQDVDRNFAAPLGAFASDVLGSADDDDVAAEDEDDDEMSLKQTYMENLFTSARRNMGPRSVTWQPWEVLAILRAREANPRASANELQKVAFPNGNRTVLGMGNQLRPIKRCRLTADEFQQAMIREGFALTAPKKPKKRKAPSS